MNDQSCLVEENGEKVGFCHPGTRNLMLHASVFLTFAFMMLTSSCTEVHLDVPYTFTLSPPPIPVYLLPFCDEYASNPETADIKYLGKQLQFDVLMIDKVVRVDPRGDYADLNYFLVGKCQFKLRYPTEMDRLTEGTIVDVVGECLGISGNYILNVDCWINVIGGNIATIRAPSY